MGMFEMPTAADKAALRRLNFAAGRKGVFFVSLIPIFGIYYYNSTTTVHEEQELPPSFPREPEARAKAKAEWEAKGVPKPKGLYS